MTAPVEQAWREDGGDAALAQAAHWLARLRRGPLSRRDAAALKAWLAEDPMHAAALDLMLEAWDQAGPPAASPAVRGEREATVRRARASASGSEPRRWAPLQAGALAALAGVAVFVGLGATSTTTRLYRTSIGQVASVALPDHSIVWLDAGTLLETRFSMLGRQVALRRGAAEFKVAHEALRPFVVATDLARVRATGTDFSVREGAVTRVVLLQGAVLVSGRGGGRPLELRAGQETTVSPTGPSPAVRTDTASELAWREGRLVFFGKPLSAVIADFTRYSDVQVRFADEAARGVLISGTFEANDFSSFLKDISSLYRINSYKDKDGRLVIQSRR